MWLADGLLLYRCYVIYCTNLWVIAFPCLLFIVSLVTGLMTIYAAAHPTVLSARVLTLLGRVYLPASLSFTVLLTLLIIIRLALHNRNLKNAMGPSAGSGGPQLYKTIITILVESYALYAVSFAVDLALTYIQSPIGRVFDAFLIETLVITPYLVTLRVANQRAVTSESIASGAALDAMQFKSRGESTGMGGTISDDERPTNWTEESAELPGEDSRGAGSNVEKGLADKI